MLVTRRDRWLVIGACAGLCVIGVLLIAQVRQTVLGAQRRLSIVVEMGEGEVVIVNVDPDGPAGTAGLRAGDSCTAINGHPVDSFADFDQYVASGVREGPLVQFSVRRGDDQRQIDVNPGVAVPWWDLTSNVLLVLAYCVLALVVLFDPSDDVRRLLLLGFSLAAGFEFALWPPPIAVLTPVYNFLIAATYYLCVGLQIGLLVHLAAVTPVPLQWVRVAPRRPWIFYAVGLAVGTVLTIGSVAAALGAQVFPWPSVVAEDLFFTFGLPVWSIVVTVLIVVQVARAREPRQRVQAQLVLIGVVPWMIFVLAGTVAQLLGRPLPGTVNAMQPLVLMAFPAAVFIAIFRYQLFDIEKVLRRGLMYGAMTIALVALFYLALVLGSLLFSDLLNTGASIWFVSAVTLALGLTFAPLRRFLQAWVDRRFFPERYALREQLIALAAELPSLGTLPRMGSFLIDRVREVFGCEHGSVLLAEPRANLLVSLASSPEAFRASDHTVLLSRDDPGVVYLERMGRPVSAATLAERCGPSLGQRLASTQVVLAVPILQGHVLVGVMLLGNKSDGSRFVAEEEELLNLLAHHVATVFENARLFESATYDPLTGLLRREAILDRLEEETLRANRYGRPLSVGMADLDHFKVVNDEHGHLAGDLVLQRISQAVRATLRSADAVGRYGGEEFLFVLPETSIEEAKTVAEKIRTRVATCPVAVGGQEEDLYVTVSIGLSSLQQTTVDPVTARDLIETADRNLLQAKRDGRDRVVWAI